MTKMIRVYGIVQGVGFRPFVSRIADRIGVAGSVANKGSYVEICVRGNAARQEVFRKALEEEAPERSAILKIDVSDCEDREELTRFEIIESEREVGDIFVSPDIATCPKCRQELFDPDNRRYMHPFINCTACGPRLTILDAMPYDRERTSMKEFPMCPACAYEYTHAETRRYDAQPVCCNECGPEVYLLGRPERGREAITGARRAILNGQIVAVKGIGGFHLCCDATNEAAVARLRRLKRRPAKPFAVMMRDLAAAEKYCYVTPEQAGILDGHQKPILLLKKRKQEKKEVMDAAPGSLTDAFEQGSGGMLAPSVAPDNPGVGVMLPYAPVQMLLFDYNDGLTMPTDCFVMTSGNVSGAPICRTDEDAEKELSGFCDVILSHNRKIRLRADDSVMDFYENQPYMIRRSRGYAPLPVMKSEALEGQVLGVGGELKNTFCIGKNQLFYPSPYVGDMADARTVAALEESILRMEELLETEPRLAVCDLHPKYNTTLVAEETGLPVVKIQHHYAHILSCMAENDVPLDQKVIGVSFDGTGYGTDQSIWGGEILLADYRSFARLGSIRPFLQIGGDTSAREGWRIAVSMINALYQEEAAGIVERLGLCDPQMQKLSRQMAEKRINCVVSTSAGRLFDAVSAILDVRKASTFEGEASTTLQFRAEEYENLRLSSGGDPRQETADWLRELSGAGAAGMTELCSTDGAQDGESADPEEKQPCFFLPTDRLVRLLTELRLEGEDTCRLAYLFHFALAEQIRAGCLEASRMTGVKCCAFSGGVFQNRLLLKLCERMMRKEGFTVYRHSLIPPNDGGLALGQAVYGMVYLQDQRNHTDKKREA